MTAVVYRTPAPQFHDLTSVEVVAGQNGTARLALSVAGGFITHPTLALNAADIAKSFIGDAIADDQERAVLAPVARDISYRPVAGTVPIMERPGSVDELRVALSRALDRGEQVNVRLGDSGPRPELPPVYSRGYAVYLGERQSYTADLPLKRFSMANTDTSDGRLLTIAFDRRD